MLPGDISGSLCYNKNERMRLRAFVTERGQEAHDVGVIVTMSTELGYAGGKIQILSDSGEAKREFVFSVYNVGERTGDGDMDLWFGVDVDQINKDGSQRRVFIDLACGPSPEALCQDMLRWAIEGGLIL
jgi:hypothetical protein